MPYVFSFGSNTHFPQLRERCRSARLAGSALLPDYRLAFAGYSGTWSGPVATIRKDATCSVPGTVAEVTDRDLAALDRAEGHPWSYRRRVVEVDCEGRTLRCWAYALGDHVEEAAPTDAYFRRIVEGYEANGLDLDVLRDAVRRSAGEAKAHVVFVYGSLLSGFGNHGILQRGGAQYLGDGRTAEAAFRMASLGAFPGVLLAGREQIVGELYSVDANGLRALDRLEGHPDFYARQRTAIEAERGSIDAWMYVLQDRRQRAPTVPQGDWRAYRAAGGR